MVTRLGLADMKSPQAWRATIDCDPWPSSNINNMDCSSSYSALQPMGWNCLDGNWIGGLLRISEK